VDLVDLIQEKRFLGQEFLAWLWYKSDQRGGSIALPGTGDVQVVFEKHMLLEYGEGEASEKVICRGLQTELKEARAGLLMGKKPEQARLRLARGEYEFHVTLTASMMEFRNVRLPKTVAEKDEGDDPESMEGMILERIGLYGQLLELVNDLFRMYLDVRTSEAWEEELEQIREWVHHGMA
jgi:recombination associated protein RdgC